MTVVDATVQAAVLASTIAAGGTVAGYLANQSRSRRERKATAFAEALTAVRQFYDFPYKVWRRTDDGPETRARLSDEHSATATQATFQLAWLQVDSPVVGEAYQAVIDAMRDERRANYALAWQTPPIADAADLGRRPPFLRGSSEREMQLCLLAMRNELSLLGPARRRRVRRLVRAQVQARQAADTSTRTPPVP